MDIQELRVGNIVTTVEGTKHYKKELEVENIINNNYNIDEPLTNVNGYSLSELKPIPLTEEWLLKMGFSCNGWSYVFGNFVFHAQGVNEDGSFRNTEFHFKNNKGDIVISFIINNVHQLQNVFFSLTGRELEMSK